MTSENTSVSATSQEAPATSAEQSSGSTTWQVHYRFEKVGDVEVFYREAGDPATPTLLLLHGFAASSYMWRAVAHPSKITAIISQNGNAYEEGLSKGWEPIRTYWNTPSQGNRDALSDFPTPASIKWQYVEGVSDTSAVAPDAYTLEGAQISQPGMADIQLDLLLDYATNVAKYPEFQAYFREHQPPLLAVWGKHDPFFLPPGAEAWKRDIPQADIRFYDTGHFALETHGSVIIPAIREFLDGHLKA